MWKIAFVLLYQRESGHAYCNIDALRSVATVFCEQQISTAVESSTSVVSRLARSSHVAHGATSLVEDVQPCAGVQLPHPPGLREESAFGFLISISFLDAPTRMSSCRKVHVAVACCVVIF